MSFDWTRGELAEGLRLYDAGEYFAAHESWEAVWLRSLEPEKTFLQALIQVTAACHHLHRDNLLGTQRLLSHALRRLEPLPSEFGGIAVDRLRDDIHNTLQSIANRASAAHIPSPRIQPICL